MNLQLNLYIHSPESAAVLAKFITDYTAVQATEISNKRIAETDVAAPEAVAPAHEAPAAAEAPKRTRGKKAEPAPEPEPAIRTTPEDRQPPAEDDMFADEPASTAVVESARVYTKADVKDAMTVFRDKKSLEALVKAMPTLTGYAKFSEVPEDPVICKKATEALLAAAG